MRLILVNYDNNYETEQFTRMFFKGLDIEKVKEVPRDLTGDFICIEKKCSCACFFTKFTSRLPALLSHGAF